MKKKTQEEVESQINDTHKNIKMIGKYSGSKEKTQFNCDIDDYTWDGYIQNVLKYGCPCCSGAVITTNSFRNEIKLKYPDIEIIGEWNGIKETIKCHCKKCNLTWSVAPRSIRETGCPRCNGSVTRKIPNEEYIEKVKEIHNGNIIVLDKYVNMNTKILHKCLKHNIEFMSKPLNVINRKCGCYMCGKEHYQVYVDKRRKTTEQFKKEVFELVGNEYEVAGDYVSSNDNILFRHHVTNGIDHDFLMYPNSFKRGQRCPCCAGYQIFKGYNDFNTKRPDLAKLLKNINDGYLHTQFSGDFADWICPECGFDKIHKRYRDVDRDGICCPRCSDGVSYPNKFIYHILNQVRENLDFLEREYSPYWCEFKFKDKIKTGKYDIFFGYKNIKYIVEMDGGLGHGNKIIGGISSEDSLYIDNQKDRLAKENDINVIRIDCDYGREDRFEFIKNNIINSELKNIINLQLINFNHANRESLSSYIIKACTLWNDNKTVKEISGIIAMHETTITNYLKSGTKYGICNYSKTESKYRSTCNSVFCITTNKMFKSITDGAKFYNISEGDISKCCRRKATFGGYYNDQKLIWVYYSEYLKMTDVEIQKYIPMDNNNYTRIICLNTRKIFDGLIYAAQWCGMKKTAGISACCKNKYKTSGTHPITGEPLYWVYYEDYINMTEEQIQEKMNCKTLGKRKSVICLNTLTIYKTSEDACIFYGLDNKLILQSCCRGETKSYGINPLDNKPLKWMYYKDYLKLYNSNVLEELAI